MSYGRIFINLGNPYPRTPRFTIMIDEKYIVRFDEALGRGFENSLMGQVVYIYGKVELYEGIPEIKPEFPEQLRTDCPADCGSVSCE